MTLFVNKMLIEIKEDDAGVITAKKSNEIYELRQIGSVYRFYIKSDTEDYPYTKIPFPSKGEAIAFIIKDGFEVFINDKKIVYATSLSGKN